VCVNKKRIKKTKKELVRIPTSPYLDNVKRWNRIPHYF